MGEAGSGVILVLVLCDWVHHLRGGHGIHLKL